MTRLFGTDGVRGIANRDLTPELAFSLGRAAVRVLGKGSRPKILVGRDTRASGEMLQAALSAGVCSAGGDIHRVGVVPTPAIAYLAREWGASAGVVISASHNPPEDNGIKFFSGEGMKLPDDVEAEMEELVRSDNGPRPEGANLGRVRDAPDLVDRYLEHLVASADTSLGGMKVVVDCANGAAFRLAPEALRRLGAEVTAIHDEPNGTNINVGCGATQPEVLAEAVRQFGADAGVAHDGDADRAILVDAEGNVIDGDQVIAACAVAMKEDGALAKDTVVTTVMANIGFRRAMDDAGIGVLETQVGDRYVLEELLRSGAVIGGEQSGHVIFLDQTPTGDGPLTAIRFLSLARKKGVSAKELASVMRRYPQVLVAVPVQDRKAAESSEDVQEAIRTAEKELGESGRVLVRASGTEPVIRVMVEAETEVDARRHAESIAGVIRTS